MVGLSSANLAAKTADFKVRLSKGETLDDILPEAFAVVREAAKRVLGMRHLMCSLLAVVFCIVVKLLKCALVKVKLW